MLHINIAFLLSKLLLYLFTIDIMSKAKVRLCNLKKYSLTRLDVRTCYNKSSPFFGFDCFATLFLTIIETIFKCLYFY